MENLTEMFLGALGAALLYYLKEMSDDIKCAVKSVRELNAKVGVVIERTDTHTNEIEILRNKTDNITSDVAHIKAKVDIT